MNPWIRTTAIPLAMICAAATTHAQAKPSPSSDVKKTYERLLTQIDRIPIYDNHSHATFPDDSDMDAQAAPPDEIGRASCRERV